MVSRRALVDLLRLLKERDYDYTCVTPATHARVLARPCADPDLRDIFGWNRSFTEEQIEPLLLECLEHGGALEREQGKLKSLVRVARLGSDLLIHSAFPTLDRDSVFLGPDTERFIRFIAQEVRSWTSPPSWIVDMGAGSGAGAIAAARMAPGARLTLVDINSVALEYASINAEAAGIDVEFVNAAEMPLGPDLVIANPPYMIDEQKRAYRDGGGIFGGEIALAWANQALDALARRGRMLLYTGACVVAGRMPLFTALEASCRAAGARLVAEEIDPDVFGEELERPAYACVERIAVIGATIEKP